MGLRWYIFKSTEVPFRSEEYPLQVLMKQVSIFNPVSSSFCETAQDERLSIFTSIINHVADHNLTKPFHLPVDKELCEKDIISLFTIVEPNLTE